MSTDYTFEEHDSLGRKNFANFLYKLIENQQNYRRDTESAGYTIAIDAAYGAGKTYFLKMFQSMVKAEGKYQTVYYNAWEHDLYEDAFTPILSLIASDDAFVMAAEDQDHSGVKEKVRSFVGHAAPTIIHSLVRAVAPGTLADGAAAGLGHLIEKWGDAQYDAYTQLRKSIDAMKAALQTAVAGTQPLIFIIDELDRCSPTFAIKTLEVVKHLLNVDGVTFVMAVDMRQLCAATRNFFGQTMDAEGYLCKIFDYMTVMPVPDVRDYIRSKLASIETEFDIRHAKLFQFISAVLTEEAISLRMIDTLLSTYRVLRDYLLTAYHHDDADELYFYCLFLKFCHPDLFQRMVTSSDEAAVVDYLSKHAGLGDPVKALKLFNHRLANGNNNVKHEDNCLHGYDYSNTSKKKIEIRDQSLILTSGDSCAIYDYNANPMLSLDDMLFVPDLRKFSQICHMTYGQYIHQQLEMFNYVMPAENPDE